MSADRTSHRHRLDHYRRQHRHRKLRRHALRAIVLGIGLLVLGFFVSYRYRQQLAIARYEATKPAALPPATISAATPTPATPSVTIPAELNLAVPFTSQAPHGVWDEAHEDYCEEASALMADRFFARASIGTPDDADQAMGSLVAWEEAHLPESKSTTAAETKQMIEANFPLTVTLSTDVTLAGIKRALASGQLVLVPAAGRELGNPFFTAPGPVYHMLVIKGYTADGRLITNDPGTRHGADYVYDADTLLNAVGDWNNGDPAHGQSVVLLVSRT